MSKILKNKKGLPFAAAFHPLLNKLSSIKLRNLYLSYINQEMMNNFTPGLIVSFRSAKKISSYLVKTKEKTFCR